MRLLGGAVAMCVLCLLGQTQIPVSAKLIRASTYHWIFAHLSPNHTTGSRLSQTRGHGMGSNASEALVRARGSSSQAQVRPSNASEAQVRPSNASEAPTRPS